MHLSLKIKPLKVKINQKDAKLQEPALPFQVAANPKVKSSTKYTTTLQVSVIRPKNILPA
jgi:hypothetical protein